MKSHNAQVHPTAVVEAGALLGEGSSVWHFCHVQNGAHIGVGTNLGHCVFVASGAVVGNNVKVQNHVSLYDGTVIEDDVFLGPSCVLTNVSNPRATIARKNIFEKILVRRGATVGAHATILCGVKLGRHSFVAAGAVVSQDVPDYGFVRGVPARFDGFMSRHGHRLSGRPGEILRCPEGRLRYQVEEPRVLRCLDLHEDEALPPHEATRPYKSFRSD